MYWVLWRWCMLLFWFGAHLHECVLTLSSEAVPFGVKGPVVAASVNLTLPRARLVPAEPLTLSTDTETQGQAFSRLHGVMGGTFWRTVADVTMFYSWFWLAVPRWRLCHCTHRCSWTRKRSFHGDPHTGRLGSNSHSHRFDWHPGDHREIKSRSIGTSFRHHQGEGLMSNWNVKFEDKHHITSKENHIICLPNA